MAKRMLIDAAHPEETRVVVTSGTRLEEFDFESSTKRQVKGNIYLAKVTRVEPSLQAAFVDYGGNRHGFLAFSEIHPDYYRIPVSDRVNAEADPTARSESAEADGGSTDDSGVPLAIALPEPVAIPEFTAAGEGDEDEDEDAAPAERDLAADAGLEPEPTAIETAEYPPPAAIDDPGTEPGAAGQAPEPALNTPQPQPEQTVEAAPSWHPAEEPAPAAEPAQPASPAAVADEQPETEPPAYAMALRSDDETVVAAVEQQLVEWETEAAHKVADPDPDALHSRSFSDGPARAEAFDRATTEDAADVGAGDENSEFQPVEPGSTDGEPSDHETVEFLGGDEVEEVEEADAERRRAYPTRHYKIQEVIKRRQIMLVQVAKEERGNKGAALTTYLSLAGRYCVLMPNTNRGGGVSRKITSIADRRRLKDILEELDIPEGMGVIVRTAGAERSKAEIRRDYEYLLRLWNEIRDLTLQSTAPALIYEEGNLIKRSIRDLYTRDIEEVLVEGEEGYRTAKAFMRTLMPSHAKRVQPYRDPQIGLFHRFQIESQIDAIHSPVAQLRSGGYIVINQTEALVSIDVNSGRSTRERNIEETALRTNLEAADEIARQLRLRDLAGLIVIDFIDMEEHRNQVAVERRLKEALKNDRARIQVGRISPFGLLEMSRQRLRPSLAEASTQPCPHCGGTGHIRSVESTALYVLRSIEEEGIRRRSAEVCIYVPTNVALYILNQKRESLTQIEERYGIKVTVARDDSLIPPNFRLERLRAFGVGEAPVIRPIQAPSLVEEDEEEDAVSVSAAEPAEPAGEDERSRRRRRRRRRRGDEPREARANGHAEADEAAASGEEDEGSPDSESERRRRRRGRRGGRVRPRREEAASDAPVAAETVEVIPAVIDEPAPEPEPVLETWGVEANLETASLAPLAGEAAAPIPPHQHHEPEAPEQIEPEPPMPVAETEAGVPFASAAEQVLEHATAVPAAAEAEAVPVVDHDAAPAPPAHSSDEVMTITEKPANPRRGWWQRLMQS